MEKLNFEPSPAIKGKYKIVNTSFPIYHSKIGKIDFREITLDQAKALEEMKDPYIQKEKASS